MLLEDTLVSAKQDTIKAVSVLWPLAWLDEWQLGNLATWQLACLYSISCLSNHKTVSVCLT